MKQFNFIIISILVFTSCDTQKVPTKKLSDAQGTEAYYENGNGVPTPAPGGGTTTTPGTSTMPGNSTTPGTTTPNTQGEVLKALTPAVGVRNFQQINETMAVVTGIVVSTQITNRYNALKAQLPTDNESKSFTFSNQVAVAQLAAEYCSQLVNNNTFAVQRDAAFGAVNFTVAPATALPLAVRDMIAARMLVKFWGEGVIAAAALAAHQAQISLLMNDLITGEPATAATTRNVVVGGCAAALAAAPTVMF